MSDPKNKDQQVQTQKIGHKNLITYPPYIKQNIFSRLKNRSQLKFQPQSFVTKTSANLSLVSRLCKTNTLNHHAGCVNTVNWSAQGDLLVSGSDDTRICVWDYNRGCKLRYAIESGHSANIFSTKFLPFHDNDVIISCAGDYQVRVFQNAKNHHVYNCHRGRVKKLSFATQERDSFFSASEDGTVRHFDLRQKHDCSGEDCRKNVIVDLDAENVEICTISISYPYFSVAGSDPTVRVYDRRRLGNDPTEQICVKKFTAPPPLSRSRGRFSRTGNITSVSFMGSEILASYSGDGIYLFDINKSLEYQIPSDADEVNLDSDPNSNSYFQHVYTGHCNIRTVKEVNFFGPAGEYVISGSDDGNIFIWEKNTRKHVQLLKGDESVVNCVQGHPFDCILATSGIENNVKIWRPEAGSITQLLDLGNVIERNQKRSQDRSIGHVGMSTFRALLRQLADEDLSNEEIECHAQ